MMKTCSRSFLRTASLLFVAAAASTLQAAEKNEPLPPDGKLVAIVAEPASIVLNNRFDYVQLLLTGMLEGGQTVDVTRLVEVANAGNLVDVSPIGMVTAKADGEGRLVASFSGQSVVIPVQVTGVESEFHVNFIRDVMPAISKMGCNAGTCHGSKDGKNGFKLSLRGYDPIFDTRALVDDLSARRINRAAPDNSLMLLKATGSVPHVGGQLTKLGEPYYKIVRAWIAGGMPLDLETPRVSGITIAPTKPVVEREGMSQQMRIVATYSDGAVRDVTREAFIETGNQDVAKTDKTGLATALRRGEAPILARFEGSYAATTLTVMGDRSGFVWQEPGVNNHLDELVAAKLQRVKTLSSPLSGDAEFIRRVYLDLTGLPPAAEDVRAFLADARETQVKRDELIDRLVGGPEYVEHWANKWADLLQVNSKFLGQEGAVAFRTWIKQAVASNMPYDEFAYAVLTASGSNRENPPASYWKTLRDPLDTMENTTHLFLGVRFNCNKCHDHPFERWTQDQYYHMAAYFAQFELKKDPASGDRTLGKTAVESAKPLFEVVYDKNAGDVTHERTGQITPPQFPYEHQYVAPDDASRREQLARWMISKDNRYFAKSYVNRLWGYLLGVGIIEPIDDIRAGNPPTNPELLDALTEQFIANGFNVQDMIRTICKSQTYQRSIATNEWNEDDNINYSHALARRLPAEVLFDAVHKVTGATSRLPGMPVGMRAAELPDVGVKLPSGFLDQFGRPARESSCECERTSGLMLGPIMALVNGPTIAEAIADPNNALVKLVAEEADNAKLIESLFMRILNRPPTDDEIEAGRQAFAAVAEEHASLKAELAAYEQKVAAKVAEAEKQQQARLAAATAALAEYEQALPEKLAAWEKQISQGEWTVLDAVEMSATSGATLAKEDRAELLASDENLSIFVSGTNGRGLYKLKFETELTGITGVRLELFPDDRLPSRGPGRAQNGNFVLNEFTVQAVPKSDPSQAAPVALTGAQADFSQQNFDIGGAIDGNPATGWASSPQLGQRRTAIFETKADVGTAGGTILNIALDQQYDDQHTIGRFRISVTTTPRPLQLSGPPEAIARILAVPADARNDEQKKELLTYYRSIDARIKELEQAVAAVTQAPPVDPKLQQLREAVATSEQQMSQQRLIGTQDIAWALINSPAFLFNR